ncbi:MAG: hypothetical protein ACXVPD_07825 [Bacteroidia bacterium]
MKKIKLLGIAVLFASVALAQRGAPPYQCISSAPAINLGGNNWSGLTVGYPGLSDFNIGTCDAADFILKALGTEKIWIKGDGSGRIGFGTSAPAAPFDFRGGNMLLDGSMGIGTTSPGSKLQVNTSATNDGVRVYQTGTSAAVLQLFHTQSGGGNWGLLSSSPDLYFFDYNIGGNNSPFYINGAVPSVYDPNDGFVGIGTSFPNRRLSVSGDVSIGVAYGSSGANGTNGFEIVGGGQVPLGRGISTDVSPSNANLDFFLNSWIATSTIAKFRFKNSITSANAVAANSSLAPDIMTLDVAGKLVLNNTYPNATDDAFVINDNKSNPAVTNFKVKRNGVVYAREVNIQLTAFPDYVFKTDYKLMPIDVLEAYINKNQHLPNVPAAEKIEKDGADLGALCKVQMEKIEELTLYVIELNKKIEALQKAANK